MREKFLRVVILLLVDCKLLLTTRVFQGCRTLVSDLALSDPATIQWEKKKKRNRRWYKMKSVIIARKYTICLLFALR